MPYVNVKLTRAEVTRDAKAQIVSEITEMLSRILNKKPEHTHVVIDLIEDENWGYAGMLTDEFRNSQHQD